MYVSIGSGWRGRLAILQRLASLSSHKVKVIFWHWHLFSRSPRLRITQCGWLNPCLTYRAVSWAGKVIQWFSMWKLLLLSVITGHSLDHFQELRMKGENGEVGLCLSVSLYSTKKLCLNPPTLKTLYALSGFQSVQSSSASCALKTHRQGRCETQLLAPSQVPRTLLRDWNRPSLTLI